MNPHAHFTTLARYNLWATRRLLDVVAVVPDGDYRRIRAKVAPGFLVGVKLNSVDFQKDGFDENDSIEVVKNLSALGMDFIEISGGNYENPQMLAKKASTRQSEAFFGICGRSAPLCFNPGFAATD